MTKHPISRRTMLRGLGVSVALPLLDVMLPRFASSAMAAAAAKAPVRTAYLFLPNGMWMPNFTPATVGANFALPPTLAPLPNVAKDFSIISGLGLDAAPSAEGAARRAALRKSILDFVADDAKTLQSQLGKDDQRKLDEFTTSIREIEKRIEAAKNNPVVAMPDADRPAGIPGDFTEHQKLMYDMMVLAFRMDLTRISTFMIAHEGSDRHYRNLGLNEGHHTSSHHGSAADKIEAVKKIDLYHMQQVAYFLERLKSIPEGNGTLLDNCMVLLGCGIGDGDRHNHNDLPVLLAGRAGGALKPGRHVVFPKDTPLCNLYLSMLAIQGVKLDRFGDSTGPLANA